MRLPSWAPRSNEPYGFCGRKATLNHVTNMSTDIRGHEALHHHHHCCDEISLSWSQSHELVTFLLSQKQRGAIKFGFKFVCVFVCYSYVAAPFPFDCNKEVLDRIYRFRPVDLSEQCDKNISVRVSDNDCWPNEMSLMELLTVV